MTYDCLLEREAWLGGGGAYHGGGGGLRRGTIYGQASGVPSPPPPQWYGLVYGVGGGGGPGVCGEGWGPLELQLEKRPGVTDQASKVRKPYASHKSYNVAQ